MRKLKSMIAAFFIAFSIIAAVSPSTVEAAVSRPKGVYFVKWTNTKFTGFVYKFTLPQDVDGIQIAYVTESKTKYSVYEPSSGLKKGTWQDKVTDFANDKITVIYLRAYVYDDFDERVYSSWSTPFGVIPWPRKVTASIHDRKKNEAKISWNKIGWADGYNVTMATHASGDWYLIKSKVKSRSVILSKYRGSAFKRYQNYYIRIMPRNKLDGQYYTSPAPKDDYYSVKLP